VLNRDIKLQLTN